MLKLKEQGLFVQRFALGKLSHLLEIGLQDWVSIISECAFIL